MIQVGDRITTVIPMEGSDDVSGIVALAIDVRNGDWMVLLYEGREAIGGVEMPVFACEIVNLFNIDVIEEKCAVPAIPEKARLLFTRAYTGASRAAQVKFAEREKIIEDLYQGMRRRWKENPEDRDSTARVIKNFEGESVTDTVLRQALNQMMVKVARHTAGPSSDQECAYAVTAASLRMVDDLIAELRRGGVK